MVARVTLGTRLRQLREAAGITPQQAARAIRSSDSKISRIELGRHAAKEIDVADLITCYGVTALAERDELLTLASVASTPQWWQRYADILPTWFLSYLGFADAATSVHVVEAHFVPGLLQTEEYAARLALLRDPGRRRRPTGHGDQAGRGEGQAHCRFYRRRRAADLRTR